MDPDRNSVQNGSSIVSGALTATLFVRKLMIWELALGPKSIRDQNPLIKVLIRGFWHRFLYTLGPKKSKYV